MTFRIGQCSACGASYKLPATFQADQARCKNCSGVVNIGKVGETAPTTAGAPPVPAAKPDEASAPKKKRSGPSMKERIQAQRRAEAEALQPKAAAAKPAAPKPAVAKAPAKAASAPVAKATNKASSAKPVSRPSSARGKRGAEAKEEGGASSRRSGSGGRRRGAPAKKKSPVAGIVGLLVLIGAVGGVAVMMNQTGETPPDGVKAADGKTPATATSEDGSEPILADSTTGTEIPEEEPVLDEAAAEAKQAEQEAAKEAQKLAKAAEKEAADKAMNDPSLVDLSSIEDFPRFKTTTIARFEELKELCAVMIDPDAGAAGNRAKAQLVEAGREAMPVIINSLKGLDLSNERQFRSADVSQKALEEICNGNNFGWKYPSQEPERFHAFDKKVIKAWADQWRLCMDSDAAWMKLAKLDAMPESTDGAGDGEPGVDGLGDDSDLMGADF